LNTHGYKIIKPTPKQIEAYQACENNNIVLYGGSIRGGKSYFLILYAFTLAFKYPNSRWIFVRQSLPVLKRTLLVSFREILENGFNQYVESFNQNDMTVKLKNGSVFVFLAESYDTDKELNRFRGLEINGAFIDEANEIQLVTFNKIIERAGSWFHSPNCPSKIIMTANPTNGWLKEVIYDSVAYIPARIFDNPYIPKEYLESLKMLPKYEYIVFVEGSWDIQLKTGGEFYKGFELAKHVKPVKYDINQTFHISIDSNVFPYIAVSIWQLQKVNDIWQIKQVHELPCKDPDNTAKRAGEKVAKWLQTIGYSGSVFMYGDVSTKARNNIDENKQSFFDIFTQQLKNAGYRITDKFGSYAPPVAQVGDFVNAIFDGTLPFAEIIIGEHCKDSINDYIEVKQDKDGGTLKKRITDPKTGVSYEPVGHQLDCSKDLIVQAFSDEFKRFQNRFTPSKPNSTMQISRAPKFTL
jgi:hypothetical protein